MSKRGRDSYHHGDLAEALLSAAEQVLEREGLEKFTLRACARAAGVSHAAPAHHFGDLDGLTQALATRAFERLTGFMDRYAEAAGPNPLAILPATGAAYIDFALKHPAMYRLMFSIEARDSCNEPLRRSATLCHERLIAGVVSILTATGNGAPDAARVSELSTLAWSIVHGFSLLALEGHLDTAIEGERRAGRDVLDLAGRVLLLMQPVFASQARSGSV